METVAVALAERSYPIRIGAGVLRDGALIQETIRAPQVMIVTNETVARLYLAPLEEALAGREVRTAILPDGEQFKTLATFGGIIDRLIESGFRRDACVVGLGGGVVGDIAGFAAASYQRGVDFVQVPTTLLAQVDSSVGGKTAVNHPRAKNMIGAFHQPVGVLTDTDTLRTLPARELSAGLAEVIKYGLILDRGLFEWLEQNIERLLALEPEPLAFAIRRSCEIKASVVAADERERGQRALLNLGHTFGHALESISGYERWLHGEAVAIGMRLAARTSEALGRLDGGACARIEALLRRAKLPLMAADIDSEEMLVHMARDKKAGDQGLRVVLLDAIGSAAVTTAPAPALLRRVIDTTLPAEAAA